MTDFTLCEAFHFCHMSESPIHRGEMVRQVLKEKGISIEWLRHKMKTHRSTVYYWFESENLNWDKIKQIGDIINYDFSKKFKEMPVSLGNVNEEPVFENLPRDISAGECFGRYEALLRDYRKLKSEYADLAMNYLKYVDKYGMLR